MRIESRPASIIAAIYRELPFPLLAPVQEISFDLGITATDTPLELAGVVVQGFNDHQLLFEQRWPAHIIRQHIGDENLCIEPGMGLALRGLHFMLHGYEQLTQVEVIVIAQIEGQDELAHGSLEIPVRYHTRKTDLHFPLHGAWWAIQGSDWSDRHKQEVFSQTYALDFVKLGADNRFFRGRGTHVEDHYSWDQPIYATAGGKVAVVIFDLPDLAPGVPPDPRMFRNDPRRTLGNAVSISHGNGEFSYYACLQQASVTVNEGQLIKRGALLGRIGNSGMSPGPHLHFHLAQGPHPFIDQGVPAQFSHFHAGGQFFEQPMTIPTRMIVIGPADDTASDPIEEN
jgi:hypothetical protein